MDVFEGIIVKHLDYKETSQIIYVYTTSGVVSFLLRGANKIKSPFLGSKDTLSHVKIYASGKDLKTVKEITMINTFNTIKSNLEKYTYSLHMLELLEHFSIGGLDHSKSYPFLIKILNKVSTEVDYIPYINMFEAKLLFLLGVNPRFKDCVLCHETNNLTFSVAEGGMICDDHPHKPTYSKKCVELFQFLYYYDLAKPSSIETESITIIELRHLLDEYYMYHLNIKTKSRTVLEGFIGY
ncbi:MAG: DNA repair protein RecO [Candidatus Izemoplasmatales bacterium]